jgi:hypothetical protein
MMASLSSNELVQDAQSCVTHSSLNLLGLTALSLRRSESSTSYYTSTQPSTWIPSVLYQHRRDFGGVWKWVYLLLCLSRIEARTQLASYKFGSGPSSSVVHTADSPPSRFNMQLCAYWFSARNRAACAISSGWPNRFSGIRSCSCDVFKSVFVSSVPKVNETAYSYFWSCRSPHTPAR